jgi:hypothetical protein
VIRLRAGESRKRSSIPVTGKDFSLLHNVQIGFRGYPTSYRYKGPFPGDKSAKGVKLTTHIHVA